jgi:hypothetical protein
MLDRRGRGAVMMRLWRIEGSPPTTSEPLAGDGVII